MSIIGKIHSVETCGTVDGPGIRFVVFLQGCPARCLYCHNPDTWDLKDGKGMSVEELMREVVKYRSYMKFSGGGVTLTGGEPLMQPDFVREIFKSCREEGIHTALDTSGLLNWANNKEVFDYTDLVLLDFKCFDPAIHKQLTGLENQRSMELLEYLAQIGKPVWVRYVLVPGITDDRRMLTETARHIARHSNVEKVEILPLHKMGEYKWEELGLEFPLKDTPVPTTEEVAAAVQVFEAAGLAVG
ncbi:pyruvate formate-lyase-activating protein [Verrucomicrobiota bacterium]